MKLLICTLLLLLSCDWILAQKFSVSYNSGTLMIFSGNVFLYLSKDNKNPKDGNVGIESFPCYRIAVKNIKPNQPVLFDDASVSFPVQLSDIEKGKYYVQAVWDNNSGGRAVSNSPGNMFNTTESVIITKERNHVYTLVCKEVLPEPIFQETQYCKEIKFRSKLLMAFYGRPVTLNAAVLLPVEYDKQLTRRFPVFYQVSGYGGDYHRFSGSMNASAPIDTTSCIRVFLDGNCPLGHCVYANSENNGPWGDALVREFIPEIEKLYRCNSGRLLSGHSSGGWSVLWLQTRYPEVFTASWSSSPDPVDFRSFQKINLYGDKSMFYSKDSSLLMTATVAGSIPWASMKLAYQMENVISRGEQMHSFDAVFSQKNKDGSPGELCDPHTGVIDSVTVKHWENYDISLYVRTNWNLLQSSLSGKIRVSVGEQDNFLLNYAVHMFDEEMKKLNAGFEFAYYPGDHFTVRTDEYNSEGNKFLEQKYFDYINSH